MSNRHKNLCFYAFVLCFLNFRNAPIIEQKISEESRGGENPAYVRWTIFTSYKHRMTQVDPSPSAALKSAEGSHT
jgi:hypothetical protein